MKTTYKNGWTLYFDDEEIVLNIPLDDKHGTSYAATVENIDDAINLAANLSRANSTEEMKAILDNSSFNFEEL